MEYNSFLLFLNQMADQRKAKVVVQGSIIFIETSNAGHWSLSTKILKSEIKKLKRSFGSYLSRSSLKWQEKGAYLKIDQETDSIYLVQEIISSKKYIPFKYLIEDFASVATEWKEILEGFSDEEKLLYRLS